MASFIKQVNPRSLKAAAISTGAALAILGYAIKTGTAESRWQQIKQAYIKFPAKADFPDLSKHNNCMATHLTSELYRRLRERVRKKSSFSLFHNLLWNLQWRMIFGSQHGKLGNVVIEMLEYEIEIN